MNTILYKNPWSHLDKVFIHLGSENGKDYYCFKPSIFNSSRILPNIEVGIRFSDEFNDYRSLCWSIEDQRFLGSSNEDTEIAEKLMRLKGVID